MKTKIYQHQIKVIIIEDDISIAKTIAYNLKKAGCEVTIIPNGADLLTHIKLIQPDVLLIDWMLPGIPGTAICSILRQNKDTANIPIIMVSSKTDDVDKVLGLEHGADDYIAKPISPPELIARIRAILRRTKPSLIENKLHYLDITIDLDSFIVTRNNCIVKLTPIALQLLQILMEYPRKVFSRQQLIEKIWSDNADVDERTIDVHVTRLRKELMRFGKDVIQTVRMIGYKME